MARKNRNGSRQRTYPAQPQRSSTPRDRKARTTPPREGYGEIIPVPPTPRRKTPFVAATEAQAVLYTTLHANTTTFATGPGGTGKTHVAIEVAVEKLLSDHTSTLLLTNPGMEIGVKLGFLPGDKDEKIALSLRPMTNILRKILGVSHFENLYRAERIIFEPLGMILGNTYDNAMIVFDEAQNSTRAQMKALLIRLGHGTKLAICGDYVEQCFLKEPNGLEDAIARIGKMPSVGHVDFTVDDIVRSDFCKQVILAYRDSEPGL